MGKEGERQLRGLLVVSPLRWPLCRRGGITGVQLLLTHALVPDMWGRKWWSPYVIERGRVGFCEWSDGKPIEVASCRSFRAFGCRDSNFHRGLRFWHVGHQVQGPRLSDCCARGRYAPVFEPCCHYRTDAGAHAMRGVVLWRQVPGPQGSETFSKLIHPKADANGLDKKAGTGPWRHMVTCPAHPNAPPEFKSSIASSKLVQFCFSVLNSNGFRFHISISAQGCVCFSHGWAVGAWYSFLLESTFAQFKSHRNVSDFKSSITSPNYSFSA